jgi:hypothetical protein
LDTVFDGVILDLSKEELILLGFRFDEEGYYYLNKLPGGSNLNMWSRQTSQGGSFGFGSGGFVNQSNKSEQHEFDFYPVIITNLKGEQMNPIDLVRAKAQESFERMNDTLVPIRFSRSRLGGYDLQDQLVWFKVSKDFFSKLSGIQADRSREIYCAARELNKTGDTTNRVIYNYSGVVDLEKIIRIKPEYLKCMGFSISEDRIEYNFNQPGINWNFWMDDYGIGSGGLSVLSPATKLRVMGEFIFIYAVTDFWGSYKAVYCPLPDTAASTIKWEENINLYLPIIIDDDHIPEMAREAIIWIYPNEQFFKCLPPEIGEPMRREFNYQKKRLDPDFVPQMGGSIRIKGGGLQKDSIDPGVSAGLPDQEKAKAGAVEDTETIPCVYFSKLCESLSGLDHVNLYPNPVTDQLHVDLVLQKAKQIRFRVFDLGGRLISDEGAPENYPAGGRYTHQTDVSKLQNGFYLMVMTDEEGAKVSRRFIKN